MKTVFSMPHDGPSSGGSKTVLERPDPIIKKRNFTRCIKGKGCNF
jgi:hypothetical protein